MTSLIDGRLELLLESLEYGLSGLTDLAAFFVCWDDCPLCCRERADGAVAGGGLLTLLSDVGSDRGLLNGAPLLPPVVFLATFMSLSGGGPSRVFRSLKRRWGAVADAGGAEDCMLER